MGLNVSQNEANASGVHLFHYLIFLNFYTYFRGTVTANKHSEENSSSQRGRLSPPDMIHNAPSSTIESQTNNIMVDKLSKENVDLKKQVEQMRRLYKSKLDELRIMLGIDADLEALLKAKPSSKES